MRLFVSIILATATWATVLAGQSSRLVVDDDSYSDQVVRACQRLLREHKLVSLDTLKNQVHTKGCSFQSPPISEEKLSPPDLCERLRESTLAVGTFYKCPDCGGWHFSSSAGFVANEKGIVCTCCHVLLEEDDQVRERYLVAANAQGQVFPVLAVAAADTDADTCLVHISATGLKPLALRPGARAGEAVYCLSHPGGYFFMFSQGLIARVSRRSNPEADEHGRINGAQSRPILLLNITAEFAPGSSGAAVVDSWGNVVGQVVSIADAGVGSDQDQKQHPSPSVPIRFCTAAEEILHLVSPELAKGSPKGVLNPTKSPKPKMRRLSKHLVCPRTQAKEEEAKSSSQ